MEIFTKISKKSVFETFKLVQLFYLKRYKNAFQIKFIDYYQVNKKLKKLKIFPIFGKFSKKSVFKTLKLVQLLYLRRYKNAFQMKFRDCYEVLKKHKGKFQNFSYFWKYLQKFQRKLFLKYLNRLFYLRRYKKAF